MTCRADRGRAASLTALERSRELVHVVGRRVRVNLPDVPLEGVGLVMLAVAADQTRRDAANA